MDNLDINSVLAEGTKWLLEMEILNNPQVENTILLNIYRVSPFIKHVQLVCDMYQKKLLVYLELSWFGRTFLKVSISNAVIDTLKQALSSFQVRVIYDKQILDKSLKNAQKLLEQRDTFTRN
jgi:hypothetical protein